MTDIDRIEPTRPSTWPKIARRRRDDEPGEKHHPHEEQPAEEHDDPPPDPRGRPHIDIRV